MSRNGQAFKSNQFFLDPETALACVREIVVTCNCYSLDDSVSAYFDVDQ
jgi:hypothetical protein